MSFPFLCCRFVAGGLIPLPESAASAQAVLRSGLKDHALEGVAGCFGRFLGMAHRIAHNFRCWLHGVLVAEMENACLCWQNQGKREDGEKKEFHGPESFGKNAAAIFRPQRVR